MQEDPAGERSEHNNTDDGPSVDDEANKPPMEQSSAEIDVSHGGSEGAKISSEDVLPTTDTTSSQLPEVTDASVPDVAIELEPAAHADAPVHDTRHTPPELSPRMLEPGIPMPVSADPTVPDPASIHTSPADSPRGTSPQTEDRHVNSLHVRSAVPPALLQQLSRSSGISGLFTPYSQTSSGSSSPVVADGTGDAEETEVDELASELVPEAPPTEPEHHGEHDADLDADGDIDPDYEEAVHEPATVQEGEIGEHPPIAVEQDVEEPSIPATEDFNSAVEASTEGSSVIPSEEHPPAPPHELDQQQPEKTESPG